MTASVQKNVFIGTAGWSYPDWKGIVYPETAPRSFRPLAFLARLVDMVEINATFYRPISSKMSDSWVAQVEGNPRFRFTAKAPGAFTHERDNAPDTARAAVFVDSLRPLVERHKLGAVLLQFPWSFRRTPENRAYLARLTDALSALPLCVEVRHTSWNHPEFFDGLRDRDIAFCNIDQPGLKDCIEPLAQVTAPFAYVRLHGRNAESWFSPEANRDARYNYLYSREELVPWVEKIMAMQKQVNDLYVVTNNHYRGQAVVNALELQASMGMSPRMMPETLAYIYPRLDAS